MSSKVSICDGLISRAKKQESFLNSVVRVLFKTDPIGFFEKSYPRLLEMNNWSNINQEIL